MPAAAAPSRAPGAGRWLAGRWLVVAGPLGLWLVGIPLLAFALHGRPLAEKAVTRLIMPLPLLWLVAVAFSLVLWNRGLRRPALLGLVWGAILWSVSTPLLSQRALRSLESQYPPWDESEEPLDALIVLGGGATDGVQGAVELNEAGDRLLMPVRLLRQGKTRHLITTGAATAGMPSSGRDPSEMTLVYWRGLGVPEEAVSAIGGRNTYEEMQQLRERLDGVLDHDLPGHDFPGPRVGLVTSAFHMPRAMRLAERAGLELIPVPCDYRAPLQERSLLDVIPSAEPLKHWELVLREHLAAWVGR